jgi:cytochrome c oxidase subunit II
MENIVKQVDAVFIYIIGFSLILLIMITAAMIVFIIKYRKSRHEKSSDIRGDWRVELAWIIIPTIIVLSMFYYGWQSFLGLRAVPPGALEIDVIGMQYAWIFNYPNKKSSEGLLVVPLGKPIKINLTSDDVIHGFYVPAFRIKMDVIKNMKTYTWFYADKIGDYNIFCTQYCGEGHADMTATLRIVTEPEYREWLNRKSEK